MTFKVLDMIVLDSDFRFRSNRIVARKLKSQNLQETEQKALK